MLHIGCIADDFTGASDIASFFKKGGMRTALYNGVPGKALPNEYDAVVVALKSRTEPLDTAVAESLKAASWLVGQGAQHLYQKYCSTFDSTPSGNIGPVMDALMEYLDVPYTVICPALPVNGRKVKEGRLFVNGVPLDESPMKDHPLTPMWESSISKLMEPQGKYQCFNIYQNGLREDAALIKGRLHEFYRENGRFYIIPDYADDEDGELIASLFADLRLITGGSGLAEYLGHIYLKEGHGGKTEHFKSEGKTLILSGSCSKATLSQVRHFIRHGGTAVFLNPEALIEGSQTVESVWAAAAACDKPVLIYSSQDAADVRRAQLHGAVKVSGILESAMAELAANADRAGYSHIIVAGGETSGAVTKRLGYTGYEIGNSVAPGVPVMIPMENHGLSLVLKSGNFGGEDFFSRALDTVSV